MLFYVHLVPGNIQVCHVSSYIRCAATLLLLLVLLLLLLLSFRSLPLALDAVVLSPVRTQQRHTFFLGNFPQVKNCVLVGHHC